MRDTVGNELNIGDHVFCLSGSLSYTIQKVEKFRIIKEHWGDRECVDFGNGLWLSSENVVSLTALGAVNPEICDNSGYDALGAELHVSDKVLYRHAMEIFAEIGTVKKLTAKTCLLTIDKNRFNQTEYRKKYGEIISLTALGKEDITTRDKYNPFI